MLLKKYYGKSLKTARETAKKELGEEIVVLESVDANNDSPAMVTVMTEKKTYSKTAEQKNASKKGLNAIIKNISNQTAMPGAILQLKDKITSNMIQERDETNSDSDSSSMRNMNEPVQSDNDPSYSQQHQIYNRKTVHKKDKNRDTMSRRKKTLYQGSDTDAEFKHIFNSKQQIQPIQQEVKALHRRFDHLEKLFSEALITANLEYVSHPAFQQLLEAGVQAPTISKWFESVLSKGIDPYEQKQSFMYKLSAIVRNALFISTASKAKKNLLFTGPSGAGKTTLIMKIAANREFMGTNKVALISIEPATHSKSYSILPLFAEDLDIPFFKATNSSDISKLLPKLEVFDYVLFDTTAISLEQEAAVREFWKLRQLVSSVNPLEIHYVINATLEKYYFRESYVENHPLQPDYVAITHLDETNKWGHLIPFLKTKKCDVRYISCGSQIPDDIQTFNPGWFTQKILS